MQITYGFAPVYIGVIVTYTIAVYLYWRYFWKTKPDNEWLPAPAD
jgi:hypothetical protein